MDSNIVVFCMLANNNTQYIVNYGKFPRLYP